MTALRKSDSQLNAEAAARIERPPLEESIAFHRALYADELRIEQLTTETPPVFVDGRTGRRRSDPMSMIGPTLSWPLTQYITGRFGPFPWNLGLVVMRERYCRKHHPEHLGRPEWRGSLCYQLVNFTIRREFSLAAACQVLGTTPERSGRVLDRAFIFIEDHIDWQQQKQADRKAIDDGRNRWWEESHFERHDQPGMHREDCPRCLRDAATLAPIKWPEVTLDVASATS